MLLAGPFTGRLLGDMGAEIIKVEPPGKPDPLRDWGKARYKGRSLWWPRPVAQQEVRARSTCAPRRARSSCSSSPSRATCSSRTSGRARSRSGTSAGSELQRGEPAARPLPRLRLRADRPLRAAGRLRLGRGGDGRHPPHQRLPGRAAAAAAHLARRLAGGDVRGAGHPRRALPPRRARRRTRPGRRRLAARGLLRAAREHRARVRPARDRPRARRDRAQGRRPLEHLQVERRQVDGDRGERRQRLPPALCEAMGPPELADDERFSTHLARGEHQEEIEGIVAEWARRARRRARSTASSTRPASSAGRSTRSPTSSRTSTSAPARCSSSTRTRSSATYIGPGIVPKFSETPGAVRWSATVGAGEPQPGGLRRAARPLRRGARRSCATEGVL